LVIEGRGIIPAHAVVESETRGDAPGVLNVKSPLGVSGGLLRPHTLAGNRFRDAQEKIAEGVPGEAAREVHDAPALPGQVVVVKSAVLILDSGLESMSAFVDGQVVGDMP